MARLLESLLRKALHDFDLLTTSSKVAVALSGGKDSLTLLYLLSKVSGRGTPPFSLHAIHVGGTFSCGAAVQEVYLKNFCASIGVSLSICQAEQPLEKLECYSCSRQRRTLLFNEARAVGASVIAFGHHQDDHAQTVLMNMLHKAEFEGLLPKVPMHEYGVTIIRPLIYAKEKQIIEFAKEQGFLRALCRCPVGETSMRRQVDKLLSHMEQLYPHARANIARAALTQGTSKALKVKDNA